MRKARGYQASDRTKYLRYITKIENYLLLVYGIRKIESKDIRVSFFDEETDEIYLQSGVSNPYKRLCHFLHEAGHAILFHRYGKLKYRTIYSFGYSNLKVKMSTKKYRIDVVREEVSAWEEGWELAQELSLRISREYYNTVIRGCLFSYIRWGAKI
jgi:hypothetical protein